MGKEPHGVTGGPAAIEQEIDVLRDRMADTVEEIDIRRQHLTDWRRQLEAHGPTLVRVLAVVGGIAGAFAVVRRQRAHHARRRRRAHV